MPYLNDNHQDGLDEQCLRVRMKEVKGDSEYIAKQQHSAKFNREGSD